MDGNIEDLVLSGKLFNPPSRSSSPVRSRSPSPTFAQWPVEGEDYDYDSDTERRRAIESKIASQSQGADSVGMGPGRTGVKGVIRDRNEAEGIAKGKRTQEIGELNKKMEKASLGGKTWAEEERERLAKKALEEGITERIPGKNVTFSKGRFGHLREVGVRTFVQAVEGEDRHIWVVVHIYDPSLDRCALLDEQLAKLAREHPGTKFLRARAGALGFATSSRSQRPTSLLSVPQSSKPPFSLRRSPSRKILVPGGYPSDEEDDDDSDEEKSDDGWEDDDVDTDMLPTVLVYRGGDLVHSWVRVDWEAMSGIEELLRRHHIISDSAGFARNPSDDEDDFLVEPEDDELFDL